FLRLDRQKHDRSLVWIQDGEAAASPRGVLRRRPGLQAAGCQRRVPGIDVRHFEDQIDLRHWWNEVPPAAGPNMGGFAEQLHHTAGSVEEKSGSILAVPLRDHRKPQPVAVELDGPVEVVGTNSRAEASGR